MKLRLRPGQLTLLLVLVLVLLPLGIPARGESMRTQDQLANAGRASAGASAKSRLAPAPFHHRVHAVQSVKPHPRGGTVHTPLTIPTPAATLTIIARTGQNNLTSLGQGPSINDATPLAATNPVTVAFVGYHADGSGGIFVGNGSTAPLNINPRFSSDPRFKFSGEVMINAKNQVLARDQTGSGTLPYSVVRIWNANVPNANTIIAKGGNPGAPFQAVLPGAALINSGQVVFSAITATNQAVLATPKGGDDFNTAPLGSIQNLIRPLIDDNGDIIVQAGSQVDAPIRLYSYALNTSTDIACGVVASCLYPGFSTLGLSPGISHDGNNIAFYGVLDPSWATSYQMTPGAGIFAALRIKGSWYLQQVTGGDPNAPTSFVPDARVAINDVRKLAFLAQDGAGVKGLYTSQLSYFALGYPFPNTFKPIAAPARIAAQGMAIPGDAAAGTVQDLNIYDPLNDYGDLAFWVSMTDGSQAIIRASRCAFSDYTDPLHTPYINQYDAGNASVNHLPIDAYGKAGGNACGASGWTMMVNAIKYMNGYTKRWDILSVYNQTYDHTAQNHTNNNYYGNKGLDKLQALGFLPESAQLFQGQANLDAALDSGSPVLMSTAFGTDAWPGTPGGKYGGGHMVLFLGRTASGDYIVDDPAGNYFASVSDHYGAGKCGENAIYPHNIDQFFYYHSGPNAGTLRYGLALPPNLSGRNHADPDVVLVEGTVISATARPYQLWLQDAEGRQTGFLPNGSQVQNIPSSSAMITPLSPSDPNSTPQDETPQGQWPYAADVITPETGLRAFVYGNRQTTYSVEIGHYSGDLQGDSIVTGTVAAGQTKEITFPPTVMALYPTSGPLGGGTQIVITGTGFTDATRVIFGTLAASFVISSDTQITATVPATTSPGVVDVTVTSPEGTSMTSPTDQYSYVASPTATPTDTPAGVPTPSATPTVTNTPTALATPTNTPVAAATLTLRPTGGIVGQTVTATGSNFFGPGEAVSLFWDSTAGAPLTTTNTTATGAFTTTFSVPPATGGAHQVIAVGQASGASAHAAFQVRAALSIAPNSGSAGSAATVSAGGFAANETVTVKWDCSSPTCGSPTVLGSATTDANGSLSGLAVTIPGSATKGRYPVGAIGGTSGAFAQTTFTVTPPVTCKTTVGGPLGGDTTWGPSGSPFCLTSSLYVPSGITLTIQPGVYILVNANLAVLVDGTMAALGTSTQPITFTASGSAPAPGAWKGIALSTLASPTRFDSSGHYTGGSAFQYVSLTDAGGTGANGALELDVPVLLDHSTIQSSGTTGLYEPAGGARVTNDTISGNLAGGLSLGGSSDTITGNTISGNRTSSSGNSAGIYIKSGGADTIMGNTISGNTASDAYGGGISTAGADTIISNTISGNVATNGFGGGIYSTGPDTITGNLISGNVAGEDGGGIEGDFDTITGNTIISNTAGFLGGGINGSSNSITGDTISGNTAGSQGGGIKTGNNSTIVNTTVTSNTAAALGGGIYVDASADISQTVIAGNQVTQGTSLGAGLYCSNCDGSSLQADSVLNNIAPAGSTAAGLDIIGHPLLLSSNSLCGNTPYDLGDRNPYSASTTLNATNNFWGSTSSSVIQSHIYDYFKNASLERVSFTPFLSAPVPPALACS